MKKLASLLTDWRLTDLCPPMVFSLCSFCKVAYLQYCISSHKFHFHIRLRLIDKHRHSRRRRGGGRLPFGSKRQKFEQIVYLFGHTRGEKPSQFQWRPFFSFGEHLNLGRKPSQFRQRNRLVFWATLNASSHFWGKGLVPPPNHFELLSPMGIDIRNMLTSCGQITGPN